jgi:hypothetical protein
MPLFLYILIILLQYIHSDNHSLITFAEALLHVFIAAGSVGGTSLGCRFELGPAVQQASALPTELRCTLLSWAAPYHRHLTCLSHERNTVVKCR